MTQFIVVSPGQSNVVASGPQFGVKYTLVSNDGIRAVFNDPEDADYIGWLSDLTGLDSPDLRENADDLVGDDGGVHGDFFYGRRPVVITGQIESRPDNISRNLRMTKLQRASNSTRTDSTLRWAPEGGVEQILYLRRQQPLRITGGYNKSFQLSMVSADPRIYAAEVKTQRFLPNDSTVFIENEGTMRTPPDLTIYGPATAIQAQNHQTGESIVFNPTYTLPSGSYIVLSARNRTVLLNGVTNLYSQVQFASTTWWEVQPGTNQVTFAATGTTANSAMVVAWQDAWV